MFGLSKLFDNMFYHVKIIAQKLDEEGKATQLFLLVYDHGEVRSPLFLSSWFTQWKIVGNDEFKN